MLSGTARSLWFLPPVVDYACSHAAQFRVCVGLGHDAGAVGAVMDAAVGSDGRGRFRQSVHALLKGPFKGGFKIL